MDKEIIKINVDSEIQHRKNILTEYFNKNIEWEECCNRLRSRDIKPSLAKEMANHISRLHQFIQDPEWGLFNSEYLGTFDED